MRLKVIAQVRAQSIAARIRPNVRQPGQPRWSRAATTMEARANGSAKTVWENLTNEAHLMNAENIERPTSNAEHPTSTRAGGWIIGGVCLFAPRCEGISLSCLNTGGKNSDEFVGFTDDEEQRRFVSCPTFALNQPRPALGFAKFFQTYLQFVDKIIPRFSGLGFAVIGVRRGAGSQNLAGNMIAGARGRQLLRQINHRRSKLQQPGFQIK